MKSIPSLAQFSALLVASTALLTPVSAFAQIFTQANCEQAYSYLGGYTLSIQSLDAGGKELSVTLSHYKGPDGDGEYEGSRVELAKASGPSSYTLPTGTLQLNPNSKSGTLVSARGTAQLECTFETMTRSAGSTTRSCVNELNASKNLKATDQNGNYFRGFAAGAFNETASNPAAIVLETQKEVYFYAGTSDISASLYVCDKATSTVKEVKQSHWLDCSDLPKVSLDDVLYSDCH